MNQDKDLDVRNYSVADLAALFRISDLGRWTAADVELREAEIRDLLIGSSQVAKQDKAAVARFLEAAKSVLMQSCAPPPPPPVLAPARATPMRSYPPVAPVAPDPDPEPVLVRDHVLPPPHASGISKPAQGTVNPISTRTTTLNLCIDTLFRDNYDATAATDCVITLPKQIYRAVSMQATSVELPVTWSTVSAARKNNEFTVYLFNMTYYATADAEYTVTVPDGTYTAATFAAAVNAIFAATAGGLEYLCVDYDTVAGRTLVRCTDAALPFDAAGAHYAPDFKFVLDFSLSGGLTSPLCKNLGWIMGFRAKWYTTTSETTYTSGSTRTTYKACAASETNFNPWLLSYVFLEIDDFHNNSPADAVVSGTLDRSYIGRNVIARVSTAAAAAGAAVVTDTAADRVFKKRAFFGPVNLTKLKVRVVDRFGEVVDLRGGEVSFVLEIEQIYE
jgi:hypothetical protein